MPSAEFSEWLAYAQIEPLPNPNQSTAIIAHTTAANLWSGKGRRPKFEDYLPKARFDLEAIDAADTAARIIKAFGAVPKG